MIERKNKGRMMYSIYNKVCFKQWMIVLSFLFCHLSLTFAQIKIGGNVYGGGNEGLTQGSTSVTVYAGDLGRVFGGARMADVNGSAYVHIDGKHASSFILIDQLYGGNDISGNIGTSATLPFTPAINTPATGTEGEEGYVPATTVVSSEWNAFVQITTKTDANGKQTSDAKKIYIGQLFGGGNGNYTYDSDTSEGETIHILKDTETGAEVLRTKNDIHQPDLDRTYLELLGGSIVNVFGGGNMANVFESNIIHLDNPSKVVNHIYVKDGKEVDENTEGKVDLLNEERFKKMGFNYKFTYPNSGSFQIGNLFGGNNKVDMAIQPKWNLLDGKVRNLYSGGNEGRMTCEQGLLMQIPVDSKLTVENVYGGCRRADVRPIFSAGPNKGKDVPNAEIKLNPNPDKIPDGFAARVRVLGGNVTNVYGGNDISGDVYGGNTVGIFTTIHGNVYGGGNGSYAYTDNSELKEDLLWRDFYYNPDAVLEKAEKTATSDLLKSVEALNEFRPNAEQVSIRIAGTKDKPTVIEGALYVGGNSATLSKLTEINNRKVELKIGSYAIADKVFLGNNGENMVDASKDGVLVKYAGNVIMSDGSTEKDFSTLDLTNSAVFSKYMEGCAMKIIPSITFDDLERDGYKYEPHSTIFGSFFCGGNVGSMLLEGKTTIDFDHDVVIFDKLVGGCNNANVPVKYATVNGVENTEVNARYEGGFLTPESNGPTVGETKAIADKLVLSLSQLRIEPKRWIRTKDEQGKYTDYALDSKGNRQLEWNTIDANGDVTPPTTLPDANSEGKHLSDDDLNRRLMGGNIYGGCYSSGHIDGNVVINLNGTVLNRWDIFDEVTSGSDILYTNRDKNDFDITKRNSGVILDLQGMDPLGRALNVFGGGFGENTEIWGSTTINLTEGYTFQIFGGSEKGAIGRGTWNAEEGKYVYADTYDPRFSCTINVDGDVAGAPRSKDENVENSTMAAAEFIYGGAFEGPILGDTRIYLGNGRVFNTFAGSCNADIWGHTETYIGLNASGEEGFPWVRDHTYGGNDLGGNIWNRGNANFADRLSDHMKVTSNKQKMHGYSSDGSVIGTTASAYTEYLQGRVDWIFGGCYGDYNYATGGEYASYNSGKPYMKNAFVNFRPTNYSDNSVSRIYGAGQGHAHGVNDEVAIDKMQDRSYVLIDIPQDIESNFENMAVFGAGSWCGLGMRAEVPPTAQNTNYDTDIDQKYSAVVDLFRGTIKNVYGGSFNEGLTRRAVVNVPSVSTINVDNIFGGAYGADPLYPCDVYESQVNYHSEAATVSGSIYGGNNQADRTLYAQVNIDVPVWNNRTTTDEKYKYAKIYGAGLGEKSWAQYTEVNLLDGARVREVYGGGEEGQVINVPSLLKWQDKDKDLVLFMYGYPEDGLNNHLVSSARIHDTYSDRPAHYNTNVHIYKGAEVVEYAYGGGLGDITIDGSGDVIGTTYVDLLGGTVKKDIYAAGTTGAVLDDKGVTSAGFTTSGNDPVHVPGFTASTTAYIEGGTCRNVYGGGWEGSVGKHSFVKKTRINSKGQQETYRDYLDASVTSTAGDIPGETHVVIGKKNGTSFINGIPAIERNAYGGGEGGPVFGTANITLYNGYVGYRFFASENDMNSYSAHLVDLASRLDPPEEMTPLTYDKRTIESGENSWTGYFQEKLHDETNFKEGKWVGKNSLYDSGCIFGGGYVDNSYVDITMAKMYGGHVRNSLFGGGEIAAIGRGIIEASGEHNSKRELQGIYKAGKANVELWEGHVHRNVFGGGRGYNNLGEGGTLYSDGYVFGQTDVKIYGGEVGTDAGLDQGDGNVFGGGDIGYVYSAYENASGQLCFGKKLGKRYDTPDDDSTHGDEGYYYEYVGGSYTKNSSGKYELSGGAFRTENSEKILTEDCKVLVEPHPRALDNVKVGNNTYEAGDYIFTTDLNTLKNKNDISAEGTMTDKDKWSKIDDAGIIIHNAVFAGGNTSSGSAQVYANTTTVFGNATAAIQDVYHRDLITLGSGHTGGLYGDGNLTFVDGFRGLNITNYGTDYYSIKEEITLDQYEKLPAREAAYYELKYKCIKECTDDDGTTYHPKDPNNENSKASTLTADDILSLFKQGRYTPDMISIVNDKKVPNPEYWTENGVLPVYAGRLMNTIQRADFCGVFGSRMVMQGAQDRVPEIVDYTNYTINRVREVSLNKVESVIASDKEKYTTGDKAGQYLNPTAPIHGNYFGIYNIVNYLGALTSDVDFGDDGTTGDHPDVGTGSVRTTDNTNTETYGPDYPNQTFYGWKKAHINDRKRNNGSSHNKVALASGVYLELTTEESTGDDLYEKDWGYITGVIELDLINVQTGIGGGFVYARNVHGKRSRTGRTHTTTTLNRNAISNKMFSYDRDDANKHEWQTSGNFVHSTQTIIDDCYNISGKYKTNYKQPDGVPAHYWFIKGSVYIYDQYISAFTGAPNAYSEKVDIPLTITAASHGTMKLLNIKPNHYAYYKADGVMLNTGGKLVINDITYYKNDPIDYWTWSLLNAAEKNLFVDSTYVTKADCKFTKEGTEVIAADSVFLAISDNSNIQTYTSLKASATKMDLTPDDGINNPVPVLWHVEKEEYVPFDNIFHSSNNISHDTGFILTYRVNNPTDWDTWYTEKKDTDNSSTTPHEKNQIGGSGYEDGPTYRLKVNTGGKVLGQRSYNVSNLISKSIYDTYIENVAGKPGLTGQADFGPASIVTSEVSVGDVNYYPGTAVSATQAASMTGSVEPAYICTNTIQLAPTEYIYMGTKMSQTQYQQYLTDYPESTEKALHDEIVECVVPAYYCTKEGLYGGNYYEAGRNYRGLEAWASMSPTDRENFTFNYDALDLLIDPSYGGSQGAKYQYDSSAATLAGAEANSAHYSLERPVDYTASYNPESSSTTLTVSPGITLKRNGNTMTGQTTIKKDDELSREVFEQQLHNEQRHYAAINVPNAGTYYVVKNPFQVGSTPYAVGNTISSASYGALSSDDQANIAKLVFSEAQANTNYYFCREAYEVATSSLGVPVTAMPEVYVNQAEAVSGNFAAGATVPVGAVISQSYYTQLVTNNQQKNFVIHGIAPTETSTLYVSRNSDISDLSKEKIITVVYQYNYDENDASGNITPVSERHVINIHINFKSGIPTVEDIRKPQIILPGTRLGMREPNVTPGAYEVTGGGWKLFEKKSDAESHTNGIDYVPVMDKLYYYHNDYYLAYYALTRLGETYSNDVQVSVANYHDMADVMNDKEHHYYIDHKEVDRKPKIYINDYSGGDTPKNGLTLFRDLIDLSHKAPETDETGAVVPFSSGNLAGHMPLERTGTGETNKPMRGGEYLEFFLRADQSAPADANTPSGFAAWTPIANGDNECFSGTLHGDGYTISGLDNSLFNHLCGDVYNLGVTGSFTSAGIAETGEGYMENCWISTTGTPTKENGVNHFPLFGNPSRSEGDTKGTIQLVNCYYPESNAYTNAEANDIHGRAIMKPDQSFYNGEVAYNLNSFYLNKRFYDSGSTAATDALGNSPIERNYFRANADGTLPTNTETGNHILSKVKYPATTPTKYGDIGYVEDRFKDGDFIYAGGSIPETADDRTYTDANGNVSYYPIWPDDYLFFGQMLTYGHEETRPHQSHPAHINKLGNRLATAATSINRVYRAPAYFRSKAMGMAHYNPYAVFAAQSADEAHTVYPNMTAIDFTGYNDNTWSRGTVADGFLEGHPAFFPPLLDNDGLTRFRNIDLTKNLLVYTPAATATATDGDSKTYTAVNTALNEPVYTEKESSSYRTVAKQGSTQIIGHPVVLTAPNVYTAQKDHFLVDRQDFNAPISYSFASGKRMWYQRTPDNYVGLNKGWEGISLPFTAELVTTHQKGEITHFYSGSTDSDKNTKLGHEYWLRELTEGSSLAQAKDENNNPIANVYTATLGYPSTAPTMLDNDLVNKKYANGFLWDYYYSKSERQDANTDIYKEYYHFDSSDPDVPDNRMMNNYAYFTAAKSYIIGFPGPTYYEFDLKGGRDGFKPKGTLNEIGILEQQTVTFTSEPGITIHVSDDETTGVTTTDGYTFKPNYLNAPKVTTGKNPFVLNANGDRFVESNGATTANVIAFRPYFEAAPTNSARTRGGNDTITRSIIFSNDNAQLKGVNDRDLDSEQTGTLDIYSKRKKIVVESSLNYTAEVRIVNVAGATISTFDIEPGETVETSINSSGVYIVLTTDNRYNKKLAVK